MSYGEREFNCQDFKIKKFLLLFIGGVRFDVSLILIISVINV